MKYALFSDVHANLEAFQAVLEAIEREEVDRYCFCGDIVGYGADPKACILLLKKLMDEKGCLSVAGNHDYAVCGKSSTENYNKFADEAVAWTKTQLDENDMQFLQTLPLIEKDEHLTLVHANLVEPEGWFYIFDVDDAVMNYPKLETPVCFIGHSHRPVVFLKEKFIDWQIKDSVDLKEGIQYIVNIGSVGQPRDGNPKASYVIYDTEKRNVLYRRMDYDIPAAQKKITEAGLPPFLAERLAIGK